MKYFRKRKNKYPAIILTLLFIAGGIYFMFFRTNSAIAEWFDSNWYYRATLAFTHNASDSAKKVKIDIDTATLITASKMQSDCGDSRFTDISGKLLRYYIDSAGGACNTASTDYYVLIPTISNGANTIYHYYGNPSAVNGTESGQFSEATLTPSGGAPSAGSEEKGPGPVGYWRFDEGQGNTTYDDSTNNNDGTLSGTTKPAWQTGDMCVSGKCLSFPGGATGSVTVANTVAGVQTVSFWVKPATSSAALIDLNANDASIISTTGTITAPNFTSPTIYVNGNVSSTLAANTWQFVTVTTGTAVSASAIKIGNVKGDYLKGFLDDVKIYPYARTAAQIKSDYNSRGSTSGVSAKIGNESAWISNGLVGYWKMDETSGNAVDSSGNANTGTWNGTGSHYPAGKFGNGGGFGTDDYVQASSLALAQVAGSQLTISAWINPTAVSGTQYIVAKNGPFFLNLSGNKVQGVVYTGTWITGTGGIAISAGQWTHVLMIYDGSNIKLYVNGTFDTATAQSGNLAGDGCFQIGRYNNGNCTGGPSGYFGGKIDEVRIYKRTFSPKEVSDLYNWAPGPVGWWKMDDKVSGNSQSLVDSSTNANTGTTYYGANLTGMNCKIIGKYGGGCLFDGTDDYITTGSRAISGTGNFTFSGWVKYSSLSTSIAIPLANGVDSTTAGFWPGYRKGSSRVLYSGWGSFTAEITGLTSQDNTWYYVASTYDGAIHKFYIDGVLQGSASYSLSNFSSGVTTFGNLASGMPYWFNGLIDEVRIYNYARTQKQIAEDMNAGHPSVGSPVGSYAAYWKFDEGHDNTIYDSSVNANTGTNHGASWTNNGKFNKALSFDGVSSYISVSDSSSLDITEAITIGAWIKTGNYYSGTQGTIVTKDAGNPAWSDYDFTVTGSPGYLKFGFYAAGGWQAATADTSKAVTDNQWHYVAVTYDRNKYIYYVDGKQGDSNVETDAMVANAGSVSIGSNIPQPTYDFNGSIDEVKIYPFALTADDIKTEYNRGSALKMGSFSDTSGLTGGAVASDSASALYCIPGDASTCSAPIGEWNFNENVSGNSQTVYDTSGNANNGTTYYGANLTGMNCKVLGKHATGCQFDGTDDYVQVADSASFTTPTELTVEAWVRPDGLSNIHGFVNKHTGGQTDGTWTLRDNPSGGAGVVFFVYGAITTEYTKLYINGVLETNPSTGTLQTGQWYHLVGVWKGTGLPDNTKKVGIGYMENDTPAYIFNGKIDDVRIFNYARTAAQVAWDYNRGGPIGWWKFDECQGLTANDSSGNSNTGTITIGATIPQSTAGTCTTPTDGTGAWYNGVSGKFNSALSFDGIDDLVTVTESSSLNSPTGNNRLTIETWAYINGWANGPSGQDTFLSKDYRQYEMYVDSGGTHEWKAYLGDGTNYDNYNSAYGLALNTWYHLTIVANGSNVLMYVNGNLKSTTAQARVLGTKTGNLYLGGRGASLYFNGILDDTKVFNYALTPLQIKLDYNQSSSVRFGPSSGRP